MVNASAQKSLGITSGVGILVIALMLIIGSTLGMLMHSTIDTVKGSGDEQEHNQKVVDNLNVSFIFFLIIGILFLVTYISFFAYESGIKQVCASSSSSPLCNSPSKSVTSYRWSVGILSYVVAAIVIVLCSEGMAMYGKISTYVGEGDKEESNEKLASGVYNTMIAFLIIAIVFVVVYSVYVSGLAKAGYETFLEMSRAPVAPEGIEMSAM